MFASFAGDPSRAATYLGYRGVIAARLGDGESARSYASQLELLQTPFAFQRATNQQWRADIAALLGEEEEAVRLLNQRMTTVGWGAWLHLDMDLEPLRDYPPFLELLRPKG